MPDPKAYDVHGKRILQVEGGKFVATDDALASDLLSKGLDGRAVSAVSAEQWTAERKRRDAGTIGGQIETAGRGALEAVGGAVDLVGRPLMKGGIALAGALGVPVDNAALADRAMGLGTAGLVGAATSGEATPEARIGAGQAFNEQTRLMQRENPLSYAGGEFAANLAAGLATGGVTAAGGKVAAESLARAGMGQFGAKALGTGAAMALEGGLYGAAATEAQARASGQSDGATAEQLIQGIGLSSLLGGGIGAVAGGTSALFRKVANRAESIAAPVEREQAAAFESAMKGTPDQSAAVALSSRLSGVKEEVLNKYGPHVNTPEAVQARHAWAHRDEIIDAKISPMAKDLQEMQDAFEPITDIVRNPTIRKDFVEALPEAMKPQAARAGVRAINDTIASAREILDALPENEYTKSSRASVQRFIDYADTTYERAIRGDTVSAADVNAAANAIKKEAQQTVKSLRNTAAPSARNNGEVQRWANETKNLFESNAQEPLRLHLEDQKIWGVAGEGQAVINKGWVNVLGERGVLSKFQSELFGKGADSYMESGRPYMFADTGKIKSWIESAGTTAGETRQAMVRDAIDGIDRLATDIGKYHEMGPGQAAQLEKLQNASQRMRTALADVDRTVSAANAIDEAAKAETKGLGKLMSPGTLAATGAILGGPLGAAAGLGIGALMRPTAMMGAREALESVAGRFGAKASGEARSWVLSAAGLKKAAASIVSATEKPRAVAHAAIPAAVAVFVGRDKDLDKAYTNRMDQLIQAKANPEQIIERLGTSSGALADFAPGVAGELVSKAQNAIDFLMSRAPSGTLDPTELMPGRKAAVSRVEMTRFARVWGAVEKPMSVLDDLRRGSATPDQIAALKAVHPETYQVIRNAVNDTILEVARRGGRIPIATRQQLDLLLDLGGAGEPAFAPGIADRIVAAREQQAQRQPKSQKTPKLMASVKLPQDNWTGTSRG
jgi:hypothetical protein